MKPYFLILTLFFITCDNPLKDDEPSVCDYCYCEIEAYQLEQDENGVYQLYFGDAEIQQFTQLRTYVGYEYEYVGWTTDMTFEACVWDFCEDVMVINTAGYSSDDGYAYQMMGVYPENIGDTATICSGYTDEFGNDWSDCMYVKVNP